MNEKPIENKIKKCLAIMGNNVWYFKHAASPAMPSGIPDIIACIKGHFVGIETKKADGTQSEVQKVVEQNIKDAGGEYWLSSSYEQFISQFNEFAKRIKKTSIVYFYTSDGERQYKCDCGTLWKAYGISNFCPCCGKTIGTYTKFEETENEKGSIK